jgi:Holliday junction resolvase RusA-like endonuclease
MQIQFTVTGTPKAQPRARAFARKFGNVYSARIYDSGTAEGWKGDIALAARPLTPPEPLAGPIRVDVDFLFPRPKCLSRNKDPEGEIRHTSKPDRDNLDKALLDCLKTLGFFGDDAQVCEGEVRKFYVSKTGRPGARVTLTTFIEPVRKLTEETHENPQGRTQNRPLFVDA